jgi:hypothetical protein
MRAAYAKIIISSETQKQVFIQELLNKGITESKDGTRIEDLDYYGLRQTLVLAKIKDGTDRNIESSENKWF